MRFARSGWMPGNKLLLRLVGSLDGGLFALGSDEDGLPQGQQARLLIMRLSHWSRACASHFGEKVENAVLAGVANTTLRDKAGDQA